MANKSPLHVPVELMILGPEHVVMAQLDPGSATGMIATDLGVLVACIVNSDANCEKVIEGLCTLMRDQARIMRQEVKRLRVAHEMMDDSDGGEREQELALSAIAHAQRKAD